jgi:hypothetical protein
MRLREDHEAAAKALILLETSQAIPTVENAIELLAHASTCEKCGTFLAEKAGCAAALIEATHAEAEFTPSAEDMIAATQKDFLVFGDAVFDRLRKSQQWSDMFAEHLALELPLERRTDLWNLREVEPSRLRCALASAEGARAIGSFLAEGRRKPVVACLVVSAAGIEQKQPAFLRVNKDRVIPGLYFAERIATYALVTRESPYLTLETLSSRHGPLSLMMWNAMAETAIRGRYLPELFSVPISETEIALSLSEQTFNKSNFATGSISS